jgi:hypothetical protein
MTDQLPDLPTDDDFDKLKDLDWLNSADVAPRSEEVDRLFGDHKPENVHGDRDRDAGIGQVQYKRLAQQRIEDAIEKAEEAEFGDPQQALDWLSEPEATDQNLPDWLREPSDEPPPSWLEKVNFDATVASGSTDWLKRVPSESDTSGLAEKVDALQKIDTGGLTVDTSWLETTDFSGDPSSAARFKKEKAGKSFDLDAFGIADVEPLQAADTSALSVEDIFPTQETFETEPSAELSQDVNDDWDDLMRLFDDTPSSSPQPAPLTDQLTSAPDFDIDALLAAELPESAAAALPQSDMTPSPTRASEPEAALPDWMLEADPFAEATPDWLSNFEPSAVPEDPLADLELPSVSDATIRPLSNLESRGDSPDWLSRLSSDMLPDLPDTPPIFGGHGLGSGSAQIDKMRSSNDSGFEPLAQNLSESDIDPSQELDALLAAMRAEHELGSDRVTSYENMFDSDLFDKSSIAELDDSASPLRGTGSLDDLFASGLFDTSEIAGLHEELAVPADLSDLFDDSREGLFSDVDFDQVSRIELPSWMQEAQEGSSASSLAAALRDKPDRPLADLDERLLALREEGLNVKVDQQKAEGLIAKILPGVPEALTAAPLITARPELTTGLTVTDAQRAQAALLTALVEDEGAASTDRQRAAVQLPIVRLLALALLAAAVVLPMATDFNAAPPPLAAFAGPREAAYVASLNALQPGDLALLAVEYDAAHAYELDALTTLTLNHLKLRGARPVVISTNSIGILRTAQLLETVYPDGANRDYFLTRLIASGVVGLRDLTNNAALLNLDASGAPNGLSVQRLDDFAVGILISSSVDINRIYAEQVVPLMARPFLLASTFAALPPSLAYYTAGQFDGVLAGYRDAVVYESLLNAAVQSIQPPAPPTETEQALSPTPQTTSPTPTPPLVTATTAPPTPTALEAVPPALTTDDAAADAPTPSATSLPSSATLAPTDQPNTATPTPTAPPASTPTPTA